MRRTQVGKNLRLGKGRRGVGKCCLDLGFQDGIQRRLFAFERTQTGADDLANRSITPRRHAALRHFGQRAEGNGNGLCGSGGHDKLYDIVIVLASGVRFGHGKGKDLVHAEAQRRGENLLHRISAVVTIILSAIA